MQDPLDHRDLKARKATISQADHIAQLGDELTIVRNFECQFSQKRAPGFASKRGSDAILVTLGVTRIR
jgi:hypothetical protein